MIHQKRARIPDDETRALSLHQSSIFFNGLQPPIYDVDDSDFGLKQLKGADVSAVSLTMNAPMYSDSLTHAIKNVALWYSIIEQYSDHAVLATTVSEIRQAKKDNKVAIVFEYQDPKPLEDQAESVTMLETFRRLGFRIIQLTYQYQNYIGSGCGELRDSGLSRFGRLFVQEMNKRRIVIDLSHVGDRTSMEAIELSEHPIIFSHSAARAVFSSVRAKTDDHLKAMAEKGGVIGIIGFSPFLGANNPTIEDFLDHIDYVVDLIGANHVGIGLDIGERKVVEDWFGMFPELQGSCSVDTIQLLDLVVPSKWVNITKGLVRRGYSDEEIRKILGENFLRVFEEVWGS
jgi:membrane dipeptidase